MDNKDSKQAKKEKKNAKKEAKRLKMLNKLAIEEFGEDVHVPATDEEALSSLSDIQKKALESMKKTYKDKGVTRNYDDIVLLRFLRAKKFDVKRAIEILKNYSTWYDSMGLEAISIRKCRRTLQRQIIMLPGTVDNEDRSILYMRPGAYYPGEMPVPELMTTVVYLLEQAVKTQHVQFFGFTFIADMKGT
mmetsp:Transcript_23943/g.26566  ORF Transcript_23943/g.26566 Transcript_23943/m.26566 type:complete len:190 (+) Transcript_23943:57-626(+)